MTDLATLTTAPLQLERAIDEAKLHAIEQFALASVEEIMLKAAEKRLTVLEARRRLVLRTFDVTDIAKLGEKLAKNKFAAEKLHEIFGGAFELLKDNGGKPLMDIQTVTGDPDVNEYRIYTYYGRYTRPDGKIIEQMGSFSTKDAFFAKAHDEWKTIDEINIVDVMVAAQTETYKKCVFRGVGLGDWSEEESRALTSEAKGHDFKGSTAAGVKTVVVAFGKAKGKRPDELNDQDITWYTDAYTKNVADPERAKFKRANQEVLDALTAEKARRAGVGTPATSGPGHESAGADDDAPTAGTKGQKLTDLRTRLMDATGKSAMLLSATVRLLSAEHGNEVMSLSDLDDATLDKLARLDDNTLADAAERAKAKKS